LFLILFAAFLNFFVANILGRAEPCDSKLNVELTVVQRQVLKLSKNEAFRGRVSWEILWIPLKREKSGTAKALAEQLKKLSPIHKERAKLQATPTRDDMLGERNRLARLEDSAAQDHNKSLHGGGTALEQSLSWERLNAVRDQREVFMQSFEKLPTTADKAEKMFALNTAINNLSYSVSFLRLLILKEARFSNMILMYAPLQRSEAPGGLMVLLKDHEGTYYTWSATSENPEIRNESELNLSADEIARFHSTQSVLD
jgi:hypothetical protein